MHISILSMQRVVNFGSVLQAWSLQQMLQALTDEPVTFLDIDDSAVLPVERSEPENADYAKPAAYPPGLLQKGKRKYISQLSKKNKKLIRTFMEQQLKLSVPAPTKPDAVVVGSDEVFNHARGVNLQLHGNVNARKILTYAAACGSASVEEITPEAQETVRQAMANFSAISVRDEATNAYVQKLYNGKIHTHLDPVLTGPLYQRKPKPVSMKKYLLVYAYGQRIRTAEEIAAIQSFAKAHGLKTVAMGGSQFWCDRYIPADPFRLLDYFHGAEYVVTDTFHGAVFSVLCRKQFGVITRRSNHNKLTGLLHQLSLESQHITVMEKLPQVLANTIDYEAVEQLLQNARREAKAYLRSQLCGDQIPLAEDPQQCSGCGLCAELCPKKAITMTPDDTGVLYPKIHYDLCIRCGKCLQNCIHGKAETNAPIAAFAAAGRDERLVKNSASGGVFATLAAHCLAQGGMVAGAVMENDLKVVHVLSQSNRDLQAMQGSKYVQSDATGCYQAVLQSLKTGKTVLFSGTPCQVAAVKKLTGDPENLITADLICHGVPPAEMLQAYGKMLSQRLGSPVTAIRFRDKSCIKPFTAAITCQNGKIYRLRSHYLSFYKYFLEGHIYRESCYSCPYASMERVGDLTLGDYWGIEKHHAVQLESGEMPARKDWSCVLVNTPKGERFFHSCSALERYPTKPEWVASENRQLHQPSQKTPQREQLLQLYRTGGYATVEKQFVRDHGGKLRFYRRMKKDLRRNQT